MKGLHILWQAIYMHGLGVSVYTVERRQLINIQHFHLGIAPTT